jgi:hypothetical protein
MKVLRAFSLVLFAASLSTLLFGSAFASDHPWDDSTVDSSSVTGIQEESGDQPIDEEEFEEPPIIVKAKISILDFLRGLFGWGVIQVEDDVEEREDSTGKKKQATDLRRYKARVL